MIANIISRDIIKPSTPTPSHLRTYNLSQRDQYSPHAYIPLILFYPNCGLSPHEKAQVLKKSLSQSLERYYPFAGVLHTPTTPYIDCTDNGVVFVEAENNSQLTKFQHMRVEETDALSQLFADGMVWGTSSHRTSLVGVQLNHFACGGMAVAVSMSHRVADGCTLSYFVNHWASVARYGSTHHQEVLPLNPHFIQSPSVTVPGEPKTNSVLRQKTNVKMVTRTYTFPNSKLSELKNKVLALGSINNHPTRFEVLASLIYKTMMTAATQNSGSFKPNVLKISINTRKKFVPELPQTTVGNVIGPVMVATRHESETSLNLLVSEIEKEKMALEPDQDLKMFLSRLANEEFANRSFLCSSFCGFPLNKVDFGWGKAARASVIFGASEKSVAFLQDTANGDGIEARVCLEEQDMEIFQNDKELLSFCL